MEIQYSEKAKFFKPNIFNILNERKAKIAQKGVKVYDLFVGTPDFPPAEHVMKVVQEAALPLAASTRWACPALPCSAWAA